MYSEISSNKRKTWLIMLLFVLIIGTLGWIVSNVYGSLDFLYLAFIFASVYALVQYYTASKIALAVNGAQEITKRDNPRLYRIVENLSITDGLSTPKVYIINDPAPNAFATGRDPSHASVCVTSGLLEMMNDQELEGVLAHELGHVKNYDIRVMLIVFGLVSAIGLLADIILRMFWWGGRDNERESNQVFLILGLVAAILAPIVAILVQLAVSRKREYLADSTGALTTRYPEGLASALEKIKQSGSIMKRQNSSTAHLFFANPLKKNGLSKLFDTHPPIDDRIARLHEMDLHV
jgi:heat shock protein HtpX